MATGFGPIQGMDTIPQEIAKDFAKLFERLLPNWSINGVYNFQAGGTTPLIAAQLNVLMHNGSHIWINSSVQELGTVTVLLHGQCAETGTAAPERVIPSE